MIKKVHKRVPDENCPPVRVRVWLGLPLELELEGNFPRTYKKLFKMCK